MFSIPKQGMVQTCKTLTTACVPAETVETQSYLSADALSCEECRETPLGAYFLGLKDNFIPLLAPALFQISFGVSRS